MTAPAAADPTDATRDPHRGAYAAIAAYLIWGLTPVYFKALAAVGAGEIIAHRVLWSVLLLAIVLLAARRRQGVEAIRRQPRLLLWLTLSAVLVTSNWLVYVWAVNAGRVLEASLGYYINPLVTVVLGALVIGERMSRWQRIAFALAALGVANQIVQVGALPWVALFLATTFALYGLLRKQLAIDPLTGLFVETLLLAPLALWYLAGLSASGELAFGQLGWRIDWLLVAAGLVTSLPLVLFAFGARRLRMATMGFLQYLAPTLMFGLGVLVYDEPFGAGRLTTFALIWAGLAIYSWEAWRRPAGRHAG
ncbi:MAG TPA: EamA family transporter RarD [Rhodocyclaceae bacterium]